MTSRWPILLILFAGLAGCSESSSSRAKPEPPQVLKQKGSTVSEEAPNPLPKR